MTLEKWYENPGNHARLNEILQEPVLKEALALIRDEATQKEDGIELVFANRNAADAAFALSWRRRPSKSHTSTSPKPPIAKSHGNQHRHRHQ